VCLRQNGSAYTVSQRFKREIYFAQLVPQQAGEDAESTEVLLPSAQPLCVHCFSAV